jgi:hypothetical protein
MLMSPAATAASNSAEIRFAASWQDAISCPT